MSTPMVGGGISRGLSIACRFARKFREQTIGTDTLLLALLLRPELREVLDAPPTLIDQSNFLAERRRAGDVSPEVDREAWRALREAHWLAFRDQQGRADRLIPQWEQETVAALRSALVAAQVQGLPWAGVDHLLAAMLADPDNRASQVVRERRLNLAILEETARRAWPVMDEEGPKHVLADNLEQLGVLVKSLSQLPKTSWYARLTRAMMVGFMRAGPALALLELEAIAEAVRLGHSRVTPLHLLLAVSLLEEQMRLTGLHPAPAYVSTCSPLLTDFGLSHRTALAVVEAMGDGGALAPRQWTRSHRRNPRSPSWTVAAVRVGEKARDLAAPSRTTAGSVHLLHAALTDDEDDGYQLLERLSLDPATVLSETARRLNR